MKRDIRLIFSVLALSTIFFISCNKTEEISMDFEIGLPYGWIAAELANEGWVFVAAPDPVNEEDTVNEALYIYKYSLPGANLQSYYEAILPTIQENDLYVSQIYASDTVINSIDFKKLISHDIAYYIDNNHDTTDINFISERYFFYGNNHGYQLLFLSPEEDYPYPNKNVFKLIMETFNYKY